MLGLRECRLAFLYIFFALQLPRCSRAACLQPNTTCWQYACALDSGSGLAVNSDECYNALFTEQLAHAPYVWGDACPACDCPLGTIAGANGACNVCPNSPSVAAPDSMVTYRSTVPSTCDARLTCKTGFWSPNNNAACESCGPPIECSAPGQWPPRCAGRALRQCEQCDQPPIPNTTIMEYGEALVLPTCASAADVVLFHAESCVFDRTPLASARVCRVRCRAGYIQMYASSEVLREKWPVVTAPVCVKCATSCPPGFSKPNCNARRLGEEADAACVPCTGLPPHARWVASGDATCRWECTEGYFSSADGVCTPCKDSRLPKNASLFAQECDADIYSFYGRCGGGSEGYCTFCGNVCPQTDSVLTWINRAPWLDSCVLSSCSTAELGRTYVASPCRCYSDAEVRACTAACSAGVTYKSRNCTRTEDTVCTRCTPPQLGRLRTSPCTPERDAVYGNCPQGKACDGTETISECPFPYVGREGVCACPLWTYGPVWSAVDGRDVCVPRACGGAQYLVDEAYGNCAACRASEDVPPFAPVATPGVVGNGACRCPEGTVLQRAEGLQPRCVPCLDLECDGNVEEERACPGSVSTREPGCACVLPPGTAPLLRDVPCYFECNQLAGYVSTEMAPFTRNKWWLTPFVFGETFSTVTTAVVQGAGNLLWFKGGINGADKLQLYVVNGTQLRGTSTDVYTGVSQDIVWPRYEEVLGGRNVRRLRQIKLLHHDAAFVTGAPLFLQRLERFPGLWILSVYETPTCTSDETAGLLEYPSDGTCTTLDRFLVMHSEDFASLSADCGDMCNNYQQICRGDWCLVHLLNGWGATSELSTNGVRDWEWIFASERIPTSTLLGGIREWIFVSGWLSSSRVFALSQYQALLTNDVTQASAQAQHFRVFHAQHAPSGLECPLISFAVAASALYAVSACKDVIFQFGITPQNGLAGVVGGRVWADDALSSAALGIPGLLGVEEGRLLALMPTEPLLYSGLHTKLTANTHLLVAVAPSSSLSSSSSSTSSTPPQDYWEYARQAFLPRTALTPVWMGVDVYNRYAMRMPPHMDAQQASCVPARMTSPLLNASVFAAAGGVGPAGGYWWWWECPGVAVLAGEGGSLSVLSPDLASVSTLSGNFTACGVDQANLATLNAVTGQVTNRGCDWQHCRLGVARVLGEREPGCLPGFYMNATAARPPWVHAPSCLPCVAPFYCPGGTATAPMACPANMLTLTDGAMSVQQCVCNAGYYVSGLNCVACPSNYWCPGLGFQRYIPCAGNGITTSSTASTPLRCRCEPQQYYGLGCDSCPGTGTCVARSRAPPTVLWLVLQGVGIMDDNARIFARCLSIFTVQWAQYDLSEWAIFMLPPSMMPPSDTAFALQMSPILWHVVAEKNTTLTSESTVQGVSECLSADTMYKSNVLRLGEDPSAAWVSEPLACGMHQEAAQLTQYTCVCVAGYELLDTGVCVPCEAGSVRQRYDASNRCVPCADENAEAPYLGMAGCTCKDGFYLPFQKAKCVALPEKAPVLQVLTQALYTWVLFGVLLVLILVWALCCRCLFFS